MFALPFKTPVQFRRLGVGRTNMTSEVRYRGALLNTCIGALVLIFMGSLWAGFGLWSLHGNATVIVAIPLALFAGLLLVVSIGSIRGIKRLPRDILSAEMLERIARIKRAFGLVNTVQGILIGATFALGFSSRHPEHIPPVVALIVGLHFIALAPILRTPFDYLVGIVLCLLALTSVLMLPAYLSTATPSENIFLWGVVTGLGTAIMLWIGAACRLRRVRASL
jgi:hypothetical protein